jgi:hypothetical protein
MQTALDKFFNWLLVSSNDPQEVSLTVKGVLLGAVPAIMSVAGVAHLNLGSDALTAFFDVVVGFVQNALAVVASVVALYGAIRKLWLTVFKGTSSTPANLPGA